MRASLIRTAEIAPGVRHFVFEAPELVKFAPGQFVSLSAQIGGETITRAYSLVSPEGGTRFELCLNRVENGLFSPYLFNLAPGDSVEMGSPLGTFTLREPARDSIFIATGTGIAPFRAMLPSALRQASVTLLFGVRFESHLLYAQEFEEIARQNPRFRFWPTLTQPGPNWKGHRGRVQTHLAEAIAGRSELDFYLCGMKTMVDETRAILKSMGFDRKQIRSEKYD